MDGGARTPASEKRENKERADVSNTNKAASLINGVSDSKDAGGAAASDSCSTVTSLAGAGPGAAGTIDELKRVVGAAGPSGEGS